MTHLQQKGEFYLLQRLLNNPNPICIEQLDFVAVCIRERIVASPLLSSRRRKKQVDQFLQLLVPKLAPPKGQDIFHE